MYYIYKIENLKNNKKYIGLTNNIKRRASRHFGDLKRGVHDNSFLQKEYNLYGKENFSLEIIFEGDVSSEEISKKEEFYIEYYDSYYNGYNQNKGGNFGPSNGGTKLTKTDILNILAATEFVPRCGGALKEIYEISNTTIKRIKDGSNHDKCYKEYHQKPVEERRQIFEDFSKQTSFKQKNEEKHSINSKRIFNKKQVFMVLANKEFKIMPRKRLASQLNIKSVYSLMLIEKGETYKDLFIEYNSLTDFDKQKIVSLFSNK